MVLNIHEGMSTTIKKHIWPYSQKVIRVLGLQTFNRGTQQTRKEEL
jgi:hypothetical protein